MAWSETLKKRVCTVPRFMFFDPAPAWGEDQYSSDRHILLSTLHPLRPEISYRAFYHQQKNPSVRRRGQNKWRSQMLSSVLGLPQYAGVEAVVFQFSRSEPDGVVLLTQSMTWEDDWLLKKPRDIKVILCKKWKKRKRKKSFKDFKAQMDMTVDTDDHLGIQDSGLTLLWKHHHTPWRPIWPLTDSSSRFMSHDRNTLKVCI